MSKIDLAVSIGQAVERRYPGSREHVAAAGRIIDELGYGDAYVGIWCQALGIPIPEVEPPPPPPEPEPPATMG